MKNPIQYHQTTFAELQQIAILTGEGFTPNAIANKMGRDRSTIVTALKREDVRSLVESARHDLGEAFHSLATMAVESITPDDLLKVNAYQRTLIGAVAFDKHRLATGQSTSNVAILTARASNQPIEMSDLRSIKFDEDIE